MTAFYNDNDRKVCRWLNELCKRNLITPGDISSESIRYLNPDRLDGYTRVHLFAGIGGWDYALRLAGWPEEREVWTGSCPCQPFSSAGKRKGTSDRRHLWPDMFRLIRECRPGIIFGEQVSGVGVLSGSPCSDEKMQEVWDRKAVLGVLRQLQGQPSVVMYGMRPGVRTEEEAFTPRENSERLSGVAKQEARIRPGERSEVASEEAGHGVQLGLIEHPISCGCGRVRVDGNQVRSRNAVGLEQSISGQNRLRSRLHGGQCSRGDLRPERDGEHMGTPAHRGDCERYFAEEARRLECSIEEASREIGGDAGPEWLAGVRTDLGKEGYAVGVCVLPAAGVGAPHIRQRLFWVANADSKRWKGKQSESKISCREEQLGGLLSTEARVAKASGKHHLLDDGIPGAVDLIRGYGNAIVPQVAAKFIRSFMECES